MQVFFWAALGVLVVSTAAGTAFVGLRGWRTWQALVSFAAGGAAGMERLAERADGLAVHADRTNARAAELEAAVERLRRSLHRAGVLGRTIGELRDSVLAVLAFLPRR